MHKDASERHFLLTPAFLSYMTAGSQPLRVYHGDSMLNGVTERPLLLTSAFLVSLNEAKRELENDGVLPFLLSRSYHSHE
jgi:hypothetical protein